jgi:hemerythrin
VDSLPLHIAWRDAFVLGIPDMDADHQRLLELLNDLYATTMRGEHRRFSARGALLARATCHVLSEEKVMEDAGYPHLAGERKEHAWFLQRLHVVDLWDPELAAETISFLRKWFVDHVVRREKAFATWLTAVGHSGSVALHRDDEDALKTG